MSRIEPLITDIFIPSAVLRQIDKHKECQDSVAINAPKTVKTLGRLGEEQLVDTEPRIGERKEIRNGCQALDSLPPMLTNSICNAGADECTVA